MKSKYIWVGTFILVIFVIGVMATLKIKKIDKLSLNSLEGTVLSYNQDNLIIQDTNNAIYTFRMEDKDISVGEHIILEYMGVIDKLKNLQDNQVVSYKVVNKNVDKENNEGIFSKFYQQASKKMETMTIDQKIKQLLLIRYPDKDISDIGGYVFFEKDFKDKTSEDVKKMINSLQEKASIPLITAVDEEGGKIVRISSNKNLVSEPFKSSKELYENGGLEAISKDVKTKSSILYNLGLNVNLAPVVDIADDEKAYMYPRTIGKNAEITAKYATTVIKASKGTDVSYVLKHFPGYGNNDDTHINEARDVRTYDDIINNDVRPFKEGIDMGAEAVLISHNIITSIDEDNPATLSSGVHNLLKVNLGFTGATITDDLDMGATKNIEKKYLKAILAGNDLLIVTDYDTAYREIKTGVLDKDVSEDLINQATLKVLAWKYYKGLLMENEK
ncbi:MAG: beta-hexosaminidase [Bacilli bacterium]|nr:beta-hexosaminidase [Bacilli bacterium]